MSQTINFQDLLTKKEPRTHLLLILSPLIFSSFSLFWLLLNAKVPVLIGSLHDFTERLVPLLSTSKLPFRDFSFEYPPLFYLVLLVNWWFSKFFSSVGWGSFSAANFFVIAPMSLALFLSLVPKRRLLSTFVLLFLALPLITASFDFIPALASVLFLLIAWNRNGFLPMTILAVAVGVKFYPLIYLPIFFLKRRGARRARLYLCVFLLVLLIPFALVTAYGGRLGIKEMLSYQAHRPIEYESVLATPYFLLSLFGVNSGPYYWDQRSTNISYGGVVDQYIASLAFLIFLLLAAYFFGRITGGVFRRERIFDLALLVTLLALVLSKVLSPQFLTWFILLIPFTTPPMFKAVFIPTLLIVLLTVMELSLQASSFFGDGELIFAAPLIVRNILLIAVTILAIKVAAAETAKDAPADF